MIFFCFYFLFSFSNDEGAAGTDIACFEDTIISVGEDGRIALISIKEQQPYRVIGEIDRLSFSHYFLILDIVTFVIE